MVVSKPNVDCIVLFTMRGHKIAFTCSEKVLVDLPLMLTHLLQKKTVGFIEFSLMLRAEGNMKSKPFGLTTHGNGKMLSTTTFKS